MYIELNDNNNSITKIDNSIKRIYKGRNDLYNYYYIDIDTVIYKYTDKETRDKDYEKIKDILLNK